MTIDEAIKHCEEVAELNEECTRIYDEHGRTMESFSCKECATEHRQLAKWLKELKVYREGINNLIENQSIEVVNPFNTYQYMRVVRVADLYDLMEVKADDC